MSHDLVKSKYGWKCRICEWQWKYQDSCICPGIPRYHWWAETEVSSAEFPYRNPPAHLKTKKQLRRQGLKPGKPSGCILLVKMRQCVYLYDPASAQPTKVSPAQKEALARARAVKAEARKLSTVNQGVLEPYKRMANRSSPLRDEMANYRTSSS